MPHVLLVDDDEVFRDALARDLERVGLLVTVATDHRDTLLCLQSSVAIDLLITDLVFPGSPGGFSIARIALMRRPEIKVIYITAFDYVATAEEKGPVLSKTLGPVSVVERVLRELGIRAETEAFGAAHQ